MDHRLGVTRLGPPTESPRSARRVLVRVPRLEEVLLAGWNMENGTAEKPVITPPEIIELQQASRRIDLSPIRKQLVDVVHNLRNTGIKVSDRRAVKIQNLIAASALISGRREAVMSDLWVLKYIWDTEEQIEILAGILDSIIEKDHEPNAHPQARYNKIPDAEELMREVQLLNSRWESGSLSFEEQNVVKDKLRYVQTRCNWIKKNQHKEHIEREIEQLWKRMLEAV